LWDVFCSYLMGIVILNVATGLFVFSHLVRGFLCFVVIDSEAVVYYNFIFYLVMLGFLALFDMMTLRCDL
jgi:glucan phosphoethanolaminetransferase (alkaline phosphatase superfamily)